MLTETAPKEEVIFQDQTTQEHNIILFNDNVNTFDHVIDMLIKVCDHDALQAEQCATLVHYSGKCAVKKGEYAKMIKLSEILAESGLTVELN